MCDSRVIGSRDYSGVEVQREAGEYYKKFTRQYFNLQFTDEWAEFQFLLKGYSATQKGSLTNLAFRESHRRGCTALLAVRLSIMSRHETPARKDPLSADASFDEISINVRRKNGCLVTASPYKLDFSLARAPRHLQFLRSIYQLLLLSTGRPVK